MPYPNFELRYRQIIESEAKAIDDAQLAAIHAFEAQCSRYTSYHHGLLRVFKRLRTYRPQGVYLHGGVGRGKTFVMDLCYQAWPTNKKQRLHFNQFMMQIHEAMNQWQGHPDPIAKWVKQWARNNRVLFLDELFVNDIGDAMIMSKLFSAFERYAVTLIVTSNAHPTELYRNGLQRSQFLPAIDWLCQCLDIIPLDGPIDYRKQVLANTPSYLVDASHTAADSLLQTAQALSTEPLRANAVITLFDRPLSAMAASSTAIVFTFQSLCMTARAPKDYVALSARYQTLVLLAVPKLDESNEDAAMRFISLIDACYDHRVILMMQASTPLSNLYQGRQHQFAFERTKSRLHEMQSEDYQAETHRTNMS